MRKVITYGTYDLLHFGHVEFLKRAKALGDYLIVGVTSDDFDKRRGKINVKQGLAERFQAVHDLGIADEIIVEEYEGQKIDDVIKYGIDVFTVGDDWVGNFDYLKPYCEVKYLKRTEGISSSSLRSKGVNVKLGLVGTYNNVKKVIRDCKYVNGLEVVGVCANEVEKIDNSLDEKYFITTDFDELCDKCNAIYISSHPSMHYEQIKKALDRNMDVLCESPIVLNTREFNELQELAKNKNCILMESIKTAYSTAYARLLLQIKCGVIGSILSVDATCTSLKDLGSFSQNEIDKNWNSICAWGPPALLSIFQILGTNYISKNIYSRMLKNNENFDEFTKIDFLYDSAVASLKVGKGAKSEGDLIITGTKGYIYVPAPWWKTEYFEIRYENQTENKRHFYQIDGEGYKYELVEFVRNIENKNKYNLNKNQNISLAITKVIEDFFNKKDLHILKNS